MNTSKVITQKNETEKFIFVSFGILLGVTSLAFLSLAAISASATAVVGTCERASAGAPCTASASATASVNVVSACSMSTSSEGTYSASFNPGNAVEITGSTLNLTCNDPNSYALYSIGFTGDTDGSNVLASSVDPKYNIATGTATSGGTSAWAMKVNSESTNYTAENSYNTYQNVPANYTKVASFSSATGVLQSSVTTSYRVYAAGAQAAGNYSGKVKYVMVHPSTVGIYTVTYNANGGTVSTTSDIAPQGGSVTLPTPTQTGYSFLGWYTASTGGEKVGDGGDSYTPSGNVTLWAQWEEISDITGITRMDQMTSEICANTTAGTTASLIDDRGTSGTISYSVAKLNDGKCWMTQNLRLTYNDTDALEVSDGEGGTTSWTPERASVTGSGTNCSASWTDDFNNPYSVYCSNATYGAYYNWTAAIASNDSSDYTTRGQVIDASICPKGWKLPQNAEDPGSFYTLYNTSPYTSAAAMLASPLNFQLAGYYYSGSLSNAGSYGYYWSSTVYGSNYAYYLYLDSSSVYPQYPYIRNLGLSVRCVSI